MSINIKINKDNFIFALWVSGQISALYQEWDAVQEAFENLQDQGFDLAIIDLRTNTIIQKYNY